MRSRRCGAPITAQVAHTTRVCAYDRAGQGWSDDAPAPQDGVAVAVDLHTLLARAGEPGPYVLAGHSSGGTLAMTYAARYPAQVAGMVLLDSSSPYQYTDQPDFAGTYAMMRRLLPVLPALARVGALHLIPPSPSTALPRRPRRRSRHSRPAPAAPQHARRAGPAPGGVHPGAGADHLRPEAARCGHRRRERRRHQRLGRRPGPDGGPVQQQHPLDRRHHPRRPARRRQRGQPTPSAPSPRSSPPSAPAHRWPRDEHTQHWHRTSRAGFERHSPQHPRPTAPGQRSQQP